MAQASLNIPSKQLEEGKGGKTLRCCTLCSASACMHYWCSCAPCEPPDQSSGMPRLYPLDLHLSHLAARGWNPETKALDDGKSPRGTMPESVAHCPCPLCCRRGVQVAVPEARGSCAASCAQGSSVACCRWPERLRLAIFTASTRPTVQAVPSGIGSGGSPAMVPPLIMVPPTAVANQRCAGQGIVSHCGDPAFPTLSPSVALHFQWGRTFSCRCNWGPGGQAASFHMSSSDDDAPLLARRPAHAHRQVPFS